MKALSGIGIFIFLGIERMAITIERGRNEHFRRQAPTPKR
jgi:hypothetical protein